MRRTIVPLVYIRHPVEVQEIQRMCEIYNVSFEFCFKYCLENQLNIFLLYKLYLFRQGNEQFYLIETQKTYLCIHRIY